MAMIDERISNFADLSRSQLMTIVFDRHESEATRTRAKDLIRAIDGARLRQAVERFEDATATFVDLTNRLLAVIDGSTSDGRAALNGVVRESGALLAEIAGDGAERAAKTVADVADVAAEIDPDRLVWALDVRSA